MAAWSCRSDWSDSIRVRSKAEQTPSGARSCCRSAAAQCRLVAYLYFQWVGWRETLGLPSERRRALNLQPEQFETPPKLRRTEPRRVGQVFSLTS